MFSYKVNNAVIYLVLLFIISSVTVTIQGQRILDFDKLSIDDGFTSSKANAILQDRKGFIWIGTWNGLNRYDGYNVETFKPGYHDTTSLSNREVSALMEDHEGNIWVGTTSGLNKFDPVTRKWKIYPMQNRIISLFEDRQNMIWVGTWSGGMYRLDVATDSIDHYLQNEIVSDIYEDSRNILWAATYYGLINFDRNTEGYKRYIPDNGTSSHSISSSIVTQIEESVDGTLWLGTWGGGLNRVEVHPNRDSLKFVHFTTGDRNSSLSSNVIYRLHYDHLGNLWLGSWDAGLSLLEPDQQNKKPGEAHFSNFFYDLRNPYGISGNNISALFVDRAGILWVGSAKIDRTNILSTGVTRYTSNIYSGDSYIESPVRSLSYKNGQLLVGTTDDLKFYHLDQGKFEFKHGYPNPDYHHNNTLFRSSSILAVLQDDDGLWLGTEDAGLLYYPGLKNLQNRLGNFRYFTTTTNPSLPGNKIANLVKSEFYHGVLWVGTMQNGFARVERKKGTIEITSYNAGPGDNQLSDNNIRDVFEDKDGKVWIGTQNGLNCFDPVTGRFSKYFYEHGDTNTVNNDVINVIYEDLEGNLWIGSNSGLNKKQVLISDSGEHQVSFKGFPDIPNISDEIITNILEDDSGNLWVGVYKGIIMFSKSDQTVNKEFFSKDYQHLIIERNSAIKGENGLFLFGGNRGFLTFHPDSLMRDVVPPEVRITDILISNEPLSESNTQVKDKLPINSVPYLEDLTLSHRAKVLTFVFSAMDYKDPKRNKYAYILEGLESSWNEVGVRNTATYTNLKPGNYLFRVSAVNSDGISDTYPAEFRFAIATPWWQSGVAYLFYLLIFAGLMYFFNKYSIIGVKEKGRIMIEHMEYEKEHEVNEMKSLFFTNITHEFRTPLTLILGPVEELIKSPEIKGYARRQTELIHKNAERLLRLVNQLMEFRKVELGKMQLYRSRANIADLLNDLYESYKSMAASRGIDFTIELNDQEIDAYIDYEKLEKAFYNLVSNAFKYSEDGSKIRIHARVEKEPFEERMLIVEVADNGIGIPEDFHDQVFERFFQVNQKNTQSTGGIGLFLSRTFIELHGGSIELESEIGKGSCFRVLLPLDKVTEVSLTVDAEDPKRMNGYGDPVTGNNETVNILPDKPGVSESYNVLIVEDDHELNEFIVTGLSEDFTVIGAMNGKEGLELARKHTPDIIITDIMMPEMDGIELARVLRKEITTSHIPLVFLTAKTMQGDEIKGLKIGAVDYIYKPFNLISLKLKVQNILENRKRIHERIRTDKLTEPEHIELTSLDEKFLQDAVRSVQENLDDSTFDVEKFSYTIGMSPNQTYRKIKALTGQTANEFIRNQRLKTAADMLLQNRRSISEIIYMVGFSSPSYFTRCFKEYYGCTPKKFIEKNGLD